VVLKPRGTASDSREDEAPALSALEWLNGALADLQSTHDILMKWHNKIVIYCSTNLCGPSWVVACHVLEIIEELVFKFYILLTRKSSIPVLDRKLRSMTPNMRIWNMILRC